MFMKTFLIPALLAGAALAVPSSKSRMSKRLAERANGGRRSQTNQRLPVKNESSETGISNVEYSSNWAGAVLVASAATYSSVTATFVAQGCSGSSGAAVSYWVGIDGDTCGTAILQTGIDCTVGGGYDAWYEWYPANAFDFNLSVSEGDTITVTVTASSSSAGVAKITNVSTGSSVSKSFSGESNKLCQTNAEWIVEDFEEGGSLVPFANFGTVTFTGASAGLIGGGSVGPSGASILDIEQSSILTSCSAGSSTVTCSYV